MELNDARQRVGELVRLKELEWVALEDALGRVLADNVAACSNLPAESRSRLDGFAVRGADTSHADPAGPALLHILPPVLAAGHVGDLEVRTGECARILTGAPLPAGTDAVAAQEDCGIQGGQLILDHPVPHGTGVTLPGKDVRDGDVVARRGELLTPTRLALVAALGIGRIPVFRRPTVALLATGDEVREIGERDLGPFTVCNNRYLLAWLTRLQGGEPVHLGVAKDDPELIAGMLADVDADLVITTGGMGMGDRDYILEAWERLGVESHFREINLSPGKSTALGSRGGKVFWGFPGSPWAAQVVFHELVAPSLWSYQGLEGPVALTIPAVLARSLKKKEGLHKVFRGTLSTGGAAARFSPHVQGAEPLFADMRRNIAYTLLGPHVVEMTAGSAVQARIPDLSLAAIGLMHGSA